MPTHHMDEATYLDAANRHASPLDGRHSQFDFDEVDSRLGYAPPGDQQAETRERLAAALAEIVRWQVQGFADGRTTGRQLTVAGLAARTACLAWMLGTPLSGMSIRTLAQHVGLTHSALVKNCVALSRKFGLVRRAQRSTTKRKGGLHAK